MYFDRPSSKDLFYSLKNLQAVVKNQRESNIFIKAPTFYNSKLKPDAINEMFYYIFRNEIQFNFISPQKLKPTNKDEILKILREQHSTSIIGHPGFSKTYKRIKESKESYKWDNMKKDIRNFIKTCNKCKENKTNRRPLKAPLQITTTSNQLYEKLFLDVVGLLPITENGNRFILTLQDDLSKFSYAYPNQNHETQALLQCQTTIMSSTINSVNQSTTSLKHIEEEFNKNFVKYNEFSGQFHNQLDQILNSELINEHFSSMNLVDNFTTN
jgi:hypothetical protein